MSLVRCNVALSEGRWKTVPTLAAIRNILGFYFRENLESVEALEPQPDAMMQLEMDIHTDYGYGHEEAVRDRIVLALLRRFKPEYESQVEIEVVSDSTDFGDIEDWDDWWDDSYFPSIERIWI